jgi:hypothetical protein
MRPRRTHRVAAHLHYPIEVPPDVTPFSPISPSCYSSDRVNANGWLGVGWDLALSSIEVRHALRCAAVTTDGGQSEIYLLDGAPLTRNPNGDGTFVHRRRGALRAHRTEGHQPDGLLWEVTDKSGTKFTYGATPQFAAL